MNTYCLVVGQLQTNCYLIYDEESLEGIVVDPGDDADYISRIISDKKINPNQIIATHGHFDHILAATELQLTYNIPFFIHKKDEFLVRRMNKTAHYFTGIKGGPPPKINGYLDKEQRIQIGKSSFKIIETPGHTPGSISLYSKKEKVTFVGDLIFADGGIGRTDFSYSNSEELEKSIKKVFKLPSQNTIYSGHGPETTIESERKFHT